MKKIVIFMNLFLALILAGCGSSGGDNTVTPAEPVVLSQWTRLFGNGTTTIGCAVAVDPDGNSYATGDTSGKLDPDRTGTPVTDAFIVKYDKDGVQKWVKQMGLDSSRTYGKGVAVDASGNTYVTGYTNANLVAGSGSSTGLKDLFVAKYNTSGTRLWVKQLGLATCNTQGFGIAVDADGNSYATGSTGGDLDGAGDGRLTGTSDVFVAKYNKDGTLLWVKQLGVAGVGTTGRSIAVDADGNSYVTGETHGGLGGNTKAGDPDVFVLKYNTAGSIQWVKQMGVAAGLKSTYGYGIAVDADGNSYATGSTGGDLDGAGDGVLVGNPDVFVMKYNTSGVLQWLKQTSATGKYATGKGIALDADANCYIAGETNADLDGSGPGSLTGTKDTFVISYDKDGIIRMIKQMGTADKNVGTYGIAATPGGACLVTGYVDANFDGQVFVGAYADAFITTKLNE